MHSGAVHPKNAKLLLLNNSQRPNHAKYAKNEFAFLPKVKCIASHNII